MKTFKSLFFITLLLVMFTATSTPVLADRDGHRRRDHRSYHHRDTHSYRYDSYRHRERYENYRPYHRMSPEYRRGDRTYKRGYRYWKDNRYYNYLGHYKRSYWYSGPRHRYPMGRYHYDSYNQLMFSFFQDGVWFSISIGD